MIVPFAMKKCTYILILSVLALLALCSDHTVFAEQREALYLAGDADYAPYSFSDENGKVLGLLPDIWNLWTASTGTDVRLELAPPSSALEMLRDNRADALIAATDHDSEGKSRTLLYTKPFLQINGGIFFNDRMYGIKDLNDLTEFQVGVVKGDLAEQKFKNSAAHIALRSYDTYAELVRKVVAGEVHVFAGDVPSCLFYLARHNALQNFRQTSTPLYSKDLRVAVRLGEQALLQRLQSGLEAISGRKLEKLIEERKGIVPAASGTSLPWILWPLLAFLILATLGILLLWNRHLWQRSKRAVRSLDAESRQRIRSETELGTVLASMTSLVMEVDKNGRILRIVPTRYVFRQFSSEKLTGRSLKQLVPEKSWQRSIQIIRRVLEQQRTEEHEYEMLLAGEDVIFLFTASPLNQDTVLLVGRDITNRKRHEEELARRVFLDTMTGLPNRALFLDRLKRAMARSQRREGVRYAVLYIDLDRFKLINESLGHAVGDALIKATGQRIEGCLRKVDTVSRFMGDEFVLLLDEIADHREALRVAERIHESLVQPFIIEGNEVYTSASIGITYSAPHYQNPDELVRDAHAAMQWSRNKHKGGCKVFNHDMHVRAATCLQLETDMRRAIQKLEENSDFENSQFALHYQPIVSLHSGHTVGLEALLRWHHPTRGEIPPTEFIPLAEETGCILALGSWALDEACSRLAQLNLGSNNGNGLTMSVNISARQLQQQTLSAYVSSCLAKHNITPQLLHLELTESMVMENPAEANTVLRELKELGVVLAMDDFGTGYSSLSHLYQFPFDVLKIDRSFICRMETGHCMHSRIIEAILSMARNLGMGVVAEGVENEFQGKRLLEMGCILAQGYHFSHPLDLGELNSLLMGNAPSSAAGATGSENPQQDNVRM